MTAPDDTPEHPAWLPTEEDLRDSNPARLIRDLSLGGYGDLYAWSISHRAEYWETMIRRLGIVLSAPYGGVLDDSAGAELPRWLPGAELNIAESCFLADPGSPAIVYAREGAGIETMTGLMLDRLSNRVAAGLADLGFEEGDAVAVDLPMTAESVAIYLGIVKAGCVVVSIADSFAADEIAMRLRIARAAAIFTSDVILRGGRRLPLYEKVAAASLIPAIVLPAEDDLTVDLRSEDLSWEDFLSDDPGFRAVPRRPDDPVNVLFSSGTTGDPKAIPWTQTTPIKCAADGHLHQDIREGDVVAWPTNLGWMMGPWLIFATLVNRGTVALYYGAPTGRGFGEFVQDAGVNVLGVVPSLVRTWRASGCLDGLDWSAVRVFSSTGEPSNAEDMRWLMDRAGNRPVIEYCGGTEIGGAYLTGTVVQPAVPATFTTPALGLDLTIIDGEVFLLPPSIGLSRSLLNRDHHAVYFEGTPRGPGGELLRRHGDRIERLPGGLYRIHGRTDDTMNLGGIKVGSAEIERVLDRVEGVRETAAVDITPKGGGPAGLTVFAVPKEGRELDPDDLRESFQAEIRNRLNPLFKVSAVRIVPELPRTASNKVMRRVLREEA